MGQDGEEQEILKTVLSAKRSILGNKECVKRKKHEEEKEGVRLREVTP